MNNQSIAFIICVNNEPIFEECLYYINRLQFPAGYSAELYAIRDAASIYQAYNKGMRATDAKYKVYMHQDVLLLHSSMISEMIARFAANPSLGMIGLIGSDQVPENRRFYRSWNLGNVLGCNDVRGFHNILSASVTPAFAIDGMFMMTQYDLPWREDLLSGWDMYDFSQSLEFQQHGYSVEVFASPNPYSLHDCGQLNLTHYDESLDVFLNSYCQYFPSYPKQSVYPPEYRKRFQLIMELKEEMKKLLFLGEDNQVRTQLERIWDERFCDTELIILRNVLDILQSEASQPCAFDFLDGLDHFEQILERYQSVKYALWRQQYAADSSLLEQLTVSDTAIHIIQTHCCL